MGVLVCPPTFYLPFQLVPSNPKGILMKEWVIIQKIACVHRTLKSPLLDIRQCFN
jgi:hypothetical protein